MIRIDAFKAAEKQKTLEIVSLEANRQETIMKPKHTDLEASLEPFWPHLEVLGRPLEAFRGL